MNWTLKFDELPDVKDGEARTCIFAYDGFFDLDDKDSLKPKLPADTKYLQFAGSSLHEARFTKLLAQPTTDKTLIWFVGGAGTQETIGYSALRAFVFTGDELYVRLTWSDANARKGRRIQSGMFRTRNKRLRWYVRKLDVSKEILDYVREQAKGAI